MPIPFGRYLLLKKLATGGMGQVLLAQKGEGEFTRLVVLKRILPHLVEDEDFFNMFRDEAKITMRLDHPNIVRLNEFGVENGVHFIEMEYVPGADLRRIERRAAEMGSGIPVGAVLRVIAHAAAGLDYAHKARDSKGNPLNLVHRDVSPQNVLVGFEGAVKLIDFGVAKAAGRAQSTATGILKGKFPYMSPEQARGGELDARSDLFSLGTILWEGLTARRLFRGDSEIVTQRLVIECEIRPPSQVEPSSPRALDSLVMKALAKDPENRFQDAAELRMAIEEFILSHAIPASVGHLSGFMTTLFADRIAREADPSFLEDDSGLTDVDAGGLFPRAQPIPRQATPTPLPPPVQTPPVTSSPSSSSMRSSKSSPRMVAAPPEPGISQRFVILAIIGLTLGALAAAWVLKPSPIEPVVVPLPAHDAGVVVARKDPDPVRTVAPVPVEIQVETEPDGALLELGGLFVGHAPYLARIERPRLPVPLRITLDGYESEQLMLTADSGPKLLVSLKKRPQARPVPKPDPAIKTAR